MALLILHLDSVETYITLDMLHIHFTKEVQSPERQSKVEQRKYVSPYHSPR
jgi:hypothetical protein